MLEAGLILSRFAHYSSVLVLFGAALFPLYSPLPVVPTFVKPYNRLLQLSALSALISLIAWFEFTAATMAGDAHAMLDVSVLTVIIKTMSFGKLWLGRLGLVVFLLVIVPRQLSLFSYWLAPLLSALLLVSLAGTGHAQEPQVAGWQWHTVADGVHLLAAGAWLGALWPLAFTLRTQNRNHIAALLLRFSAVGQIAVGVLFLSGVLNSWFLVDSFNQLVATTYGKLLSLKIALFLVMLGLAAANRFWITPEITLSPLGNDDNVWLVRLRKHVVAEQLLGLFILGLVSFLGTLQPAAIG